MENLYNYIFWFNPYTEIWYGIPKEEYINFFSGKGNYECVLSSNKIETLISIINNPSIIDKCE